MNKSNVPLPTAMKFVAEYSIPSLDANRIMRGHKREIPKRLCAQWMASSIEIWYKIIHICSSNSLSACLVHGCDCERLFAVQNRVWPVKYDYGKNQCVRVIGSWLDMRDPLWVRVSQEEKVSEWRQADTHK